MRAENCIYFFYIPKFFRKYLILTLKFQKSVEIFRSVMTSDEFFKLYPLSVSAEMKRLDDNDPNWRKIFIQKVLRRWETWIRFAGIGMDLNEMKNNALERDVLMWPLAKAVFKHDADGQNARLVKNHTSQSFLRVNECLKILGFILSEPELGEIVDREEGKLIITEWYETNFLWEFTDGEEVTLSSLIVSLTSFCLSEFFDNNRNEGFSSIQVYMCTQFRDHTDKNCTNLRPYFGICSIFKRAEEMDWDEPEGFMNSEADKDRAYEFIRDHFLKVSERSSIQPLIFNLD